MGGSRIGFLQVSSSSRGHLYNFEEPSSSFVTAMPSYTVTIATGNQWFAGTDNYIYITLVGMENCSERTLLDKPLYNDFERGAVSDVMLLKSCEDDSVSFLYSVELRALRFFHSRKKKSMQKMFVAVNMKYIEYMYMRISI